MDKQHRRDTFRRLRKAAGLNQEKMGKILCISRQAVQRIETGYEDRAPTALQIRAAEIVAYNAKKGQLLQLAQYLKKGAKVTVIGTVSTREWQDASGSLKTSVEMNVSEVALQGGGMQEAQGQHQQQAVAPAPTQATPIDDSEIPF